MGGGAKLGDPFRAWVWFGPTGPQGVALGSPWVPLQGADLQLDVAYATCGCKRWEEVLLRGADLQPDVAYATRGCK